MYCGWFCGLLVGKSGKAQAGLKVFGWDSTGSLPPNIVSPAAPARPFAWPALLPVCAVHRLILQGRAPRAEADRSTVRKCPAARSPLASSYRRCRPSVI
jgi:hypothetical protein